MKKHGKNTTESAQEEKSKAADAQAGKDASAAAESPSAQANVPTPDGEAEASAINESPEDVGRLITEANDRFLRAKAELDNYRKRVQREYTEIRESSKSAVVEEFLPVFDHFQMAMEHVGENADIATLKQGMDMILNEFKRTLESLGVEQINALDKEFDPTLHEAIAQESSGDVPEGQVMRQWKCGYRIGGKLLRPATVVVSSGPDTPSAQDE